MSFSRRTLLKASAASAVMGGIGAPLVASTWEIGESEMTKNAQIPDSRIIWPPEHSPASSRVFAQNTIDIAAAPETVWSLLIDCVKWPSWYKHCSDVSVLKGGPLLSANSQFRFKTLGFYFEPEIVTFRPNQMLIWSAQGPAGTSGAHAWYIEHTAGSCHVTTEEAQRGLLLFFIGARTRGTLLNSHQEWLRALKALSEAR
jgi:uncharacterized membrane protein